MGKRGGRVWTDGNDEEHLARGVFDTYVKRNLRYSQARHAPSSLPQPLCPPALLADQLRWGICAAPRQPCGLMGSVQSACRSSLGGLRAAASVP